MATLNLHNPEGLYSGGSVSVNALPYARLAMEARDRKQAREDAIDKYYQKMPDTINDKGVRDQEIPVINEYKNKIYEFGLKNKEALRNPKLDNGAASFTLQKLMRDAAGVARESQNAAKTDLELGKLWFNKENQWALSNDDFIKQHDQHNLPVTDPNYKKMDLANVMSQRPFDQNTFVKQLKTQFPYSEKVSRETDKSNPLYDIVTTKPVLDQKTKLAIYDFAADKLHNDYTFKNKIQKDLAGTGQIQRLQDISQEVFGKPIETDEDLAAAYTVSQMYTPPTKEKSDRDITAVMDKQLEGRKEMAGIQDAYIIGRMALNQGYKKAYKDYTAGVDAGKDEEVLNKFVKNTYDNGTQQVSAYIGGKDYKGRLVDLPKDIKDKYIFSKGNTDEAVPDTWLLTDDMKTLVPMFYGEKTKSGGHELKSNPNSKPIDIQNFKVDLGKILLTQKQRGGEVIDQFDVQEAPAVKPKAKPKSNPLGLKF